MISNKINKQVNEMIVKTKLDQNKQNIFFVSPLKHDVINKDYSKNTHMLLFNILFFYRR